ncbi:MAG: DNA repair protein RecN [Clostridia bacterium]|nr:DNA repair protein RecN [Clostridia bacterium]
MLKSLHIENIAVIQRTDIDFRDGLNVLTGETGAGKSIVIDAINAVLGERTSRELIRAGTDSAVVSALFCDLSDYAKAALTDNGYNVDNEGNLLITRRLSLTGNSAIKINGQPATAGLLKVIGRHLINIHGQHDSQSLLNPENHYVYIDRMADNGKLASDYYNEFHHLNIIRKELSRSEINEEQKKRETELLNYQIKELTDADLKVGEAEELKKKIRVLKDAQKIRDSLNTAYAYINGDEDSDGAFSRLHNAQKEISGYDVDELKSLEQKIGELLANLDDITTVLRRLANSGETNGEDMKSLEDRLDLIYKTTMKYGNDEQSAIDYLNEANERLHNIELSDKKISQLSAELDASTERLVELGDKLSNSRKLTAEAFQKRVTEVLGFLDMPDALFEVNIKKGRYTRHGCDEIEFMIKTNVGEEIKPLSKIASGGELSRVMLALKSVLASNDDVDTLIFDEIDSGISGRAAEKVGYQLKSVSHGRQTVCVTHLAQIAAFAVNHLLIEKSVVGDRTYTCVKTLSGDERIEEIARIMAGSNITDNVYRSAKEMLERTF